MTVPPMTKKVAAMAKALTVTSAVSGTVPATVSAAVSTVAMSASKRRCRDRQGGRRERESGNSNEFLDPVHGLLLDFRQGDYRSAVIEITIALL
jgi:hypothetical protein